MIFAELPRLPRPRLVRELGHIANSVFELVESFYGTRKAGAHRGNIADV